MQPLTPENGGKECRNVQIGSFDAAGKWNTLARHCLIQGKHQSLMAEEAPTRATCQHSGLRGRLTTQRDGGETIESNGDGC